MIDKIKAIIFDLDGTLIDSMFMWSEIDLKFLAEYGVSKPDDFSESVKKMTINEAPKFFNKYINPPLDEDFIINHIYELAEDFYKNVVDFKDGVREFLGFIECKNIPYCIVTATYTYLAKTVIERLNLDKNSRFLLTPIDISETCSKRSPEIFLKACEMLGENPSDILVIEDSLHCILSAKAAGCVTLGIFDEFSKDDWADIQKTADYSVLSLRELI